MVAVDERTNVLGADSHWVIFSLVGEVACPCSSFPISSDLSKCNRLLYLAWNIPQSVDDGHEFDIQALESFALEIL